ncbi:hypothetical protein RHMOL_Rhmol12G0120800 [Rhododendron molle]|uniref:Uncharacterized protein n=1 Tax=Rhododendron molle TaxID=49168 RepID=A0ACC0LI57_RHOML|nr:hypothetical protein RHMOL_Rhmol12G0120800 [Rhododendron molle]
MGMAARATSLALLYEQYDHDRLLKWGMVMDDQCVLCSAAVETHEHLFFQCSFSVQLWKHMQRDLQPQCPFDGLLQIMDWMIEVDRGTQFSCLLSNVALAALVYHVWGERNCRIFKSHGCNVQQLESKVRTDIRACVSSWRSLKKSGSNIALCSLWNIPVRVFEST